MGLGNSDITRVVAALVAGALAMCADLASAQGAYMPVTGWTTPPIGHIEFCRDEPGECARRGDRDAVGLSNANWHTLLEVNTAVNRAVRPVTDEEYYKTLERWALPAGYGDCEDYALLKRRELAIRGWPTGALLIAVVFDEIGDGHAVLVVRTDRGEFVLDNRTNEVRRWDKTVYRFVKRQSIANPRRWVSVGDNRWRQSDVSTASR